MKNEFYWLIKHFDDQTLNQFRSRFDMESGAAVMQATKRLYYDAIQLQKDGVAPESEQGQNLAKEFWQMMMELTGGDMRLLPKLMEVENLAAPNDEWKQNQASANAFIESALDVYLTNLGINPFEAFEQD